MLKQVVVSKILLMIKMRLGYAYKTTLILTWIGQWHYPLITPKAILHWRLITMEGCIVRTFIIVSTPIHEAKTIKRSFNILAFPNFLKNNLTFFSQVPLGLWMPNILIHSSMGQRGIVLILLQSLFVFSVQFPLGQNFQNLIQFVHMVLTLLFGEKVGDNNEAILFEVVFPFVCFLEANSIILWCELLNVH